MVEDMADRKPAVIKNIDYPKSNVLISAKTHASLWENKILCLALCDPSRFIVSDGGETIRVTIPASEIKLAMGGNAGSFYRDLKKTAQAMNNRQIGIISDETKTFAYYQIIQTAIYDNSELRITFNSDLSQYIKDLTENFTLLNTTVMLSLTHNSSFKLYEFLRSKTFNRDKRDTNNQWIIECNLSELYIFLGVVNSDDDKVKKVLGGNKNPDFEKAVEVASDKKKSLLDWSTFKKQVLIKAIDELNEKTDINVEYMPVRGGVGGKVKSVIFTVTKKDVIGQKKSPGSKSSLSDDEKIDFIFELRELMGEFGAKELRAIAEASEYDMDKCKQAFEVYKKADRATVNRPVGYIIDAIQKGYKPSGKVNQFNQYPQNTYDFDELEKKLIKN